MGFPAFLRLTPARLGDNLRHPWSLPRRRSRSMPHSTNCVCPNLSQVTYSD